MMLLAHTKEIIQITSVDLMIAAGLMVLAGVISFAFRLGLERRMAVASVRTVVQLLILGAVLKYVFAIDAPWAVICIVSVMIAAASRAAVGRSSRKYRGVHWLAFGSLIVSGLFVTTMVTQVVIGIQPWYAPQYVIPLLGMILGNGLTGISLCLDNILEILDLRRHEIEMELSHGATRWEAARPALQEAVRKGMIPIINSMMVVGLVSLPGMMTGQILAGNDPAAAVNYQIVVMFMIAAATALACILMAWGVCKHLFNEKHQLLHEKIIKKPKA